MANFHISLSWPKYDMKATNLLVVQWEHRESGRKSCWGMKHKEGRRATENEYFLCRLCRKAPRKFSGSADVVFPNSSIFIGSKNSPNLTKRKYEMKSHKGNSILVLFIPAFLFFFFFPLSLNLFRAVLHLWQSPERNQELLSSMREEQGAQETECAQCCEVLGTEGGHWDTWSLAEQLPWAGDFGSPSAAEAANTQHEVPVFQELSTQTCLWADWRRALHTLSPADLTELFLLSSRTAQLTSVCSCCSSSPQRRAKDAHPKGAAMEPALLFRNLIFTLQLRV